MTETVTGQHLWRYTTNSWEMTGLRRCVDCGRPMLTRRNGRRTQGSGLYHQAHGLCASCYERKRQPRPDRPRREYRAPLAVEEYEFLADQGLSLAQIAKRLGMKQASLERAIYRHRARLRQEVAA